MIPSKLSRIALIIVVILAGLWLIAQAPPPALESAARQEALQALAPIRQGIDRPVGGVTAERIPEGEIVAPAAVDLSTIPAGVYDPNNQLDRWKRGEIDLEERESIVAPAQLNRLREQAQQLAPSANLQQAQPLGPGLNAPSAGAAWDSIFITECCGGGANVPPDPHLAVGPNHVIAVVNVAFEIYNKSGSSLVGPTTFASFLSSDPNCTGVFDPNALYDESTDRYVMMIDADGTHICIAVSQTGNPTGTWNIYSFQTGSSQDFFDYPHGGIGRDALYMGANIFRCTFSCTFRNSRVWAFDKNAMYNGQPAASAMKILPTSEDTPYPLNLHGWNQGTWPSSGPHYFFTETNYNGATYSVWSWNNPFGGTSPALVGTVDLQAYTGVSAGLPVAVPQSGGQTIQANDFRPHDFEYRNGFAWSTQTIACNPGGGTVDCIRWAKINPATASIVDAGVYASSGQYRFFPNLAVNHCQDMAVGYTRSSSSTFPSIWYTGRENSDAAGTLQAEALLKAGEVTYTAFDSAPRRWGDYTGMTIAPDGLTFWYLGEYSKNTGNANGRWGTYIGSFSFPSCTVGGDPPTPTPTGQPPTPTNTPVPPTPTALPTATPTPQPSSTMHIGDLDGSSVFTSGNRWSATVNALVLDGNNNPVSSATVSGTWSNGTSGSGSCTTGSNGRCNIVKTNIQRNRTSVTFTVGNVTKSGFTYNASANTDPDGDSNGTTIVVLRP